MTDEDYMQHAIDVCRRGIESGQTPFGAVIVRDGTIVTEAHNGVWMNTDITAHAEVECIRAACRARDTVDLTGATIYSTTEPCPMCFSAIHWAKLDRIVYGASIADARKAGFSELDISNQRMKELGGSTVDITRGILAQACTALFDIWKNRSDRRVY